MLPLSIILPIMIVLLHATYSSVAFHHRQRPHSYSPVHAQRSIAYASAEADGNCPDDNPVEPKACYYKRIDGAWKPRKQLHKLFIGERLFATRLPECDLIDGVTGPKAFLECGVGRVTDEREQKWNIVNGMLRIGKKTGKKNRMKESVVRKRLAKMPSDSLFEVYVSRINLEHASFEVCLNRKDALEVGNRTRPVSASSLRPGQQLFGYVKDVTPYGVFVDVGANRKGLLHITKVAQYNNQFIDKEKGLEKVGLKRGTPINVVVLKNEKKRLELGYPPLEVESDEKEGSVVSNSNIEASSGNDRLSEQDEELAWAAYYGNSTDQYDVSEEEEAMWAAYASNNPSVEEKDEKDDYDEDRDIEDALGIGYY